MAVQSSAVGVLCCVLLLYWLMWDLYTIFDTSYSCITAQFREILIKSHTELMLHGFELLVYSSIILTFPSRFLPALKRIPFFQICFEDFDWYEWYHQMRWPFDKRFLNIMKHGWFCCISHGLRYCFLLPENTFEVFIKSDVKYLLRREIKWFYLAFIYCYL